MVSTAQSTMFIQAPRAVRSGGLACGWGAARRGARACRQRDRRGADRPRPRSALHRRRRRPPPTRPTGHVPRTFTSPVPPAHSASRVYWSTAWTALIRTSGTTARPSDLQLGDVVGGEVAVPGGLDGLAGGG